MTGPVSDLPRITAFAVRNYRVLRDVRLTGLTPLTALLGPNGSGKSTALDAVAFLAEAVADGLGDAWSKRGDLAEIRSFGASGPVEIGITGTPGADAGMFRYHLSLDEDDERLVVRQEALHWRATERDDWIPLLGFREGKGTTYLDGSAPGMDGLASRGALALNTFGSLNRYRKIVEFRRFIEDVGLFMINLDNVRGGAGRDRHAPLRANGRNLASVVDRLRTDHAETFDLIIRSLRRYVPSLADVEIEERLGGSLLLRVRDAGFDERALPENTSDGTLKLLAYLVALWDPYRSSVLLSEAPENFVHHRLLQLMAEDARAAAERGQVLVATHSPHFVDALRPDEVWVSQRGADGYTEARRVADLPGVVPMVESGRSLGDLWAGGYFEDGLVSGGSDAQTD